MEEKKRVPLPEMSIVSLFPCVTQDQDTGKTGKCSHWIQAASWGSSAANSEPVVPENAESQSGTLPMGVLVLFNSLGQLESTQLMTT